MDNRYKYFKISIFLLLGLFITVSILMNYTVYLIKNNESISDSAEIDVNNVEDFIDDLSFDLNDLAYKELSHIDLASKVYENNTISITDSDFKLSENLENDIYQTIHTYGISNSFYLVSLDDGMTIGYNVDSSYETASSIKAPYALYIYEEAAKGNIDLNQEIAYEPYHFNNGTGNIKNNPYGTMYKVSDLVYRSLTDSDNVAHTMLHKTFGVNGYNDMLKRLGTKKLYLTNASPWGMISPRSSALIWQEIYNFAISNEYGIELMNILSNGLYNWYKEVLPNTYSASKTGFASKDVIETGIVFDDKPYIGIAVANIGGSIDAYKQVLKLISYMDKIMKEYKVYLTNQ